MRSKRAFSFVTGLATVLLACGGHEQERAAASVDLGPPRDVTTVAAVMLEWDEAFRIWFDQTYTQPIAEEVARRAAL